MSYGEPPTPDAGGGEQHAGAENQIIVSDPEDFAKTRQLRSIFDALDDYQETKREVTKAYRDGDVSFTNKTRYIFEYMQDFAMAVEPIAKTNEKGVKLWTEKTYRHNGIVTSKYALLGTEDAKRQALKPLIEEYVDGLPTTSELRKVIDIVGFKLPEEKLGKIEEHYETQRENRLSTTLETQSLLAADFESFSRINAERPTSEFEQLAFADPEPEPEATEVADLLVEAIDDQSSRKADKAKFKLRKYATDWGWETEGVGSMVRSVPRLVYPHDRSHEFRPSAPPKAVADEVVQDLRELIQELGLGIDFGEEQQTKIDDDLLDEVDEWRGNNV